MTETAGESPNEDGGALSNIGDALEGMVTGVPAPIRKNAIQAFTRLCTAGVEYPVTLIENAIAERKAESRARIKLIDTSSSQISEKMYTDPEYARAAVKKFGQKILRERINIDNIAGIASDELRSQDKNGLGNPEEIPPLSEDWINIFEGEACNISSESMQLLFGKILAGEIRKPSAFSIKTVKIISQLDNNAAILFRKLCSLSISMRVLGKVYDARVVSLGNAGDNSLQSYGLGFSSLNVLQEYGLIIGDYNSYADYSHSAIDNKAARVAFTYNNKLWGFSEKMPNNPGRTFKIHGVALSSSGLELLPIIDVEENKEYTKALWGFCEGQGNIIEPMSGTQ